MSMSSSNNYNDVNAYDFSMMNNIPAHASNTSGNNGTISDHNYQQFMSSDASTSSSFPQYIGQNPTSQSFPQDIGQNSSSQSYPQNIGQNPTPQSFPQYIGDRKS